MKPLKIITVTIRRTETGTVSTERNLNYEFPTPTKEQAIECLFLAMVRTARDFEMGAALMQLMRKAVAEAVTV